MTEIFRAIGLMSGTSMDGIDVAALGSDGENHVKRGVGMFVPYSPAFRQQLARALDEARSMKKSDDRPGSLREIELVLTRKHAEAVTDFLKARHLVKRDVDLIGFHGQTVLHRPEIGLTVQLGDGALLARMTGIDTVFDFRTRDVEAGGQGAPLVPAYHQALAKSSGLDLPICIVNIGGVGNVTWIGERDGLLAFDTGPGNALIDDWMARHGEEPMDRDGSCALSGRLSEPVLSRLLENSYFDKEPPKSLDRNAFSLEPVEGLSREAGAATLTAFTALSIAQADFHFPMPPKLWVITGGGTRNPALMAEFEKRLPGDVKTADQMGWSSEFMEAEAFAYLAVRSHKGLPLTYPTTTGVPHPITGGKLVTAAGG